jgi:hypothetical protein
MNAARWRGGLVLSLAHMSADEPQGRSSFASSEFRGDIAAQQEGSWAGTGAPHQERVSAQPPSRRVCHATGGGVSFIAGDGSQRRDVD